MTTATASATSLYSYDDSLAHVREHFKRVALNGRLFTTDASGLWDLFLSSLPEDRRQHYTCHACRSFVNRYGGLAVIVDGRVQSALWSVAGRRHVDDLDNAIFALGREVARAKITGVFVAGDDTLGTPEVGGWSHFSVVVPAAHINRSPVKTAGQVMADKREEYAMLSRSFGEFSHATVQRAHELLISGQLYRSEKCQGVAKWLVDLYDARAAAPSALRNNVTWLAVADAPPGFCHVRSGMIGTLLEDIETGLSFDVIKRRFDEKMHPLQYLRPTAPPSAGNIAQAEKLVAQLETAGALARRFARLDDVDALWLPKTSESKPAAGGVFGHLLGQSKPNASAQALPPVTMTWVKFRDTVLPNAASVEYYVHHGVGSYCAIVTAVNADAPPLLQWDRPERRNPTSWYLYHGGSRPGKWNLRSGEWVKVNAFTLRPCQWYGNEATKEGNAVLVILNDARDTEHRRGGGFFPENLRSEYHGVRKTLEAYAQAATIEGREQASACGIMLQGGVNWVGMMFRVTSTTGTVATYNLDRWD